MTRGWVFLGAFKPFKPIDQMDDAELDAWSESVVQGIAKRVQQRLDRSTAPVLRATTKAGSVVNNHRRARSVSSYLALVPSTGSWSSSGSTRPPTASATPRPCVSERMNGSSSIGMTVPCSAARRS